MLLVTLFSRKVSLGRLWLARRSFVYKTLRLVRIFLLTNALNKRVLLFFLRKLFYKSNRKLFSCVCISWYKHSRGWENSRQLCKPSTSSRVCITVSIFPTPLVFISSYANTENVFYCLNIILLPCCDIFYLIILPLWWNIFYLYIILLGDVTFSN